MEAFQGVTQRILLKAEGAWSLGVPIAGVRHGDSPESEPGCQSQRICFPSTECGWNSLPEFMNFKLFGKTILVVNIKFGLSLGHPLRQ